MPFQQLCSDNSSQNLTRTSGASGSGKNQVVGDSSNPTKRGRDDSQDESKPGKKLDNKASPMKSAPTGSDTVEDELGNLTEEEMITQIDQVSLNDKAVTYAGAAKKPRVNVPNLLYI